MRAIAFLLVVVLAACGGGGSGGGGTTSGSTSSNPPAVPYGTVAGFAIDGALVGATVSIYDYSTGAAGALLGRSTTDSYGAFSVSLRAESRPILIDVTAGYYMEDAAPNVQVNLTTQHLSALAYYTTGGSITVAVTPFTHLAAGLAAYQIAHGTDVSTAITNANTRISNVIGEPVLTVIPKSVVDPASASATLTPALRYGFFIGALSQWAYNNAPSPATRLKSPYTAIDLTQTLYNDIAADGLLDGNGTDAHGNPAALSFGLVPMTVGVYRHDLAVAMLQLAANGRNVSGITGADILAIANDYAASSEALFGSVAPTSIAGPVPTFTAPAQSTFWRSTLSVAGTVASGVGAATTQLLIDGNVVATASSAAAPSFTVDTTAYVEGAHTLTLRAIDTAGQVATVSRATTFDRTPPTLAMTPGQYATVCADVTCPIMANTASYHYFNTDATNGKYLGTWTDTYSPTVTVTSLDDTTRTVSSSNGAWLLYYTHGLNFNAVRFQIKDVAGNCSIYKMTAYSTRADSAYVTYVLDSTASASSSLWWHLESSGTCEY